MKTLGQKGQAFSVFQLLIAAIVAVFILVFLLQILSNITPPSQGDPIEESASKIKSMLTKLGTPERTSTVTFIPGTIMTAGTIAQKTGALSENDICLTVGSGDQDNPNFEKVSSQAIEYSGRANVTRRLYILCDLARDIESTLSDLSGVGFVDEAFSDHGCSPPATSNKYCIVSVIPTGT